MTEVLCQSWLSLDCEVVLEAHVVVGLAKEGTFTVLQVASSTRVQWVVLKHPRVALSEGTQCLPLFRTR